MNYSENCENQKYFLTKKKGLKGWWLFKVESELSLIIQVVYGHSIQIIINNNNKHVMTGSERNS